MWKRFGPAGTGSAKTGHTPEQVKEAVQSSLVVEEEEEGMGAILVVEDDLQQPESDLPNTEFRL